MTFSTTTSSQIVSDVFGDLPDALINEILTRSSDISELAGAAVDSRVVERDELRDRALTLGLIKSVGDLSDLPDKSVAAVDGSVAVVRLASFELAAAAALAVEGLGRNSVTEQMPFEIEVKLPGPIARANEIGYGLMFCMEYDVAASVEHDLVMLDGAFSTGMVAISIALRSASDLQDDLSKEFRRRWTESTMEIVPELLDSDSVVALPKRSSSNEFVNQTRLFGSRQVDTNGRSTASLILEAGEYSGPFQLETHGFHLDSPDFYRSYTADLQVLYSNINVVYFKPKDWTHAYRIEVPPAIANDTRRLHETLESVRRQTVNPAIKEPYPLYVADRFAKSLKKGIDALLDSVRAEVVSKSSEPTIAADMMNAYRTDPSFEEPSP